MQRTTTIAFFFSFRVYWISSIAISRWFRVACFDLLFFFPRIVFTSISSVLRLFSSFQCDLRFWCSNSRLLLRSLSFSTVLLGFERPISSSFFSFLFIPVFSLMLFVVVEFSMKVVWSGLGTRLDVSRELKSSSEVLWALICSREGWKYYPSIR